MDPWTIAFAATGIGYLLVAVALLYMGRAWGQADGAGERAVLADQLADERIVREELEARLGDHARSEALLAAQARRQRLARALGGPYGRGVLLGAPDAGASDAGGGSSDDGAAGGPPGAAAV